MLTPIGLLAAVLVVAAGVAAVAAPNARHATVGAFAAILLAVLVADPLPSPAGLVARAAGALLGGWLVWMALRGSPARGAPTAVGWAGATGLAVAAFAVGWLVATTVAGALVSDGSAGPDAAGATLQAGSLVARGAVGAAAALGVLAAGPIVMPRDGHRLGLAIALLLAAATLLSAGLAPAPDDTLQLGIAILTALTGAAVAAVTSALRHTDGDLLLRDPLAREPLVRHRATDDAHRGRAS